MGESGGERGHCVILGSRDRKPLVGEVLTSWYSPIIMLYKVSTNSLWEKSKSLSMWDMKDRGWSWDGGMGIKVGHNYLKIETKITSFSTTLGSCFSQCFIIIVARHPVTVTVLQHYYPWSLGLKTIP